MENWIGYLLLLGCIGIVIRAILMGTEKMIRLILGNYIIATICFAFGACINTRANQLAATPQLMFLKISYQSYANFLHQGQLTFTLLLFAILVTIVYTSSKINVSTMQGESSEKLYYILLIPLTLFSFIFALYVSLLGEGITTLQYLQNSVGSTFDLIQQFLNNIYVRMLAHGILIVVITSKISIKFKFSKQSTSLPDGLEDL